MAALYDLRPVSTNLDKEKKEQLRYYPQIVNKGTIETWQLVRDIHEMSTFTKGEIEGLIKMIEDRIAHYLSEGHHVQLGGIGHFSLSLKSKLVEKKTQLHAQSIRFDTVNFRPSPSFIGSCWGNLERVPTRMGFRKSNSHLSEEARLQRLTAYLKKNGFISRPNYSALTGLLKNKALADLNKWRKEGILGTSGRGTHIVYVLKEKEQE